VVSIMWKDGCEETYEEKCLFSNRFSHRLIAIWLFWGDWEASETGETARDVILMQNHRIEMATPSCWMSKKEDEGTVSSRRAKCSCQKPKNQSSECVLNCSLSPSHQTLGVYESVSLVPERSAILCGLSGLPKVLWLWRSRITSKNFDYLWQSHVVHCFATERPAKQMIKTSLPKLLGSKGRTRRGTDR
jgi:hypothetical protein